MILQTVGWALSSLSRSFNVHFQLSGVCTPLAHCPSLPRCALRFLVSFLRTTLGLLLSSQLRTTNMRTRCQDGYHLSAPMHSKSRSQITTTTRSRRLDKSWLCRNHASTPATPRARAATPADASALPRVLSSRLCAVCGRLVTRVRGLR